MIFKKLKNITTLLTKELLKVFEKFIAHYRFSITEFF